MKYFLPTEIPRLSSYPVFLPPPPPAAHPAEAATYINQQIQVRNSPGGQCACANFPPLRLDWQRCAGREAPIRKHQASDSDRTVDSAWQI